MLLGLPCWHWSNFPWLETSFSWKEWIWMLLTLFFSLSSVALMLLLWGSELLSLFARFLTPILGQWGEKHASVPFYLIARHLAARIHISSPAEILLCCSVGLCGNLVCLGLLLLWQILSKNSLLFSTLPSIFRICLASLLCCILWLWE